MCVLLVRQRNRIRRSTQGVVSLRLFECALRRCQGNGDLFLEWTEEVMKCLIQIREVYWQSQ
jgi:hypothetical protein